LYAHPDLKKGIMDLRSFEHSIDLFELYLLSKMIKLILIWIYTLNPSVFSKIYIHWILFLGSLI